MTTLKAIEQAALRIKEHVRRTPTVNFSPLRDQLPYDVWLKLENLQVTVRSRLVVPSTSDVA